MIIITPTRKRLCCVVLGLIFSISTFAQLPTAQAIAAKMRLGWNLGNTLESICSPTAWGGLLPTRQLIALVKASGFNAVRLPCAWDCHTTNGVIDPGWLATVKQAVDLCIDDSLYVIINIHWDDGWLENNVTTTARAAVNAKQQNYWTQIARYFRDYDEHLLFASANEPNASDATGMSVLLSYHQTFVDAVRATGGNNSSRTLIIQGPQTNIGLTNTLMNTLPADPIAGRMMVEVHYYDPPQFCILTEDASWGNMFYYWGTGYHSATDVTRNATYGEESHLDSCFNLMKTKFIDKGIPVIIGEFGAPRRSLSPPSENTLARASREYFYRYVVRSAKQHGLIPFVWDTNMDLYNRGIPSVPDQGIIDAMNSQKAVRQPEVSLNVIPHNLFWEIPPLRFLDSGDNLTIEAGSGTDVYRDSYGSYLPDNAPRLLFQADSNFILTADVGHAFSDEWSAGGLMLESDSTHWIKFCFEKDNTGAHRIVSVVTNEYSDDCNAVALSANHVFLKLAKAGNVIILYYSQDGSNWQMARRLRYVFPAPPLVGFLVQAPGTRSNTVHFGHIQYQLNKVVNPFGISQYNLSLRRGYHPARGQCHGNTAENTIALVGG